jgi:ribonuclease HII
LITPQRHTHNGASGSGDAETAAVKRRADLRYERKLWQSGLQAVAGVDEAGVGPMAGPVVAAAVIFTPETHIKGVHDSKQLLAAKREELYDVIIERAQAYAVGVAEVDEIDRLNIYHATLAACGRAVAGLRIKPEHVLIDGRPLRSLSIPQTHIVGGDRKSFCIAAASIIAKVTRDRLMCELDNRYPGYGLARHKGYCTAEHIEAVGRLGPSPIHRTSFAPVGLAAQLSFKLP